MSLTAHEVTGLAVTTAVTVVAGLFLGACVLWQQQNDINRLREHLAHVDDDVDAVWAWINDAAVALGWAGGDGPNRPGDGPPKPEPGPAPPGVGVELEPDTVVSHPADLFARKQALLARYTNYGQHRA